VAEEEDVDRSHDQLVAISPITRVLTTPSSEAFVSVCFPMLLSFDIPNHANDLF